MQRFFGVIKKAVSVKCDAFNVLICIFSVCCILSTNLFAQEIKQDSTALPLLPWGTPLGYFWRVRSFANGNTSNYYNDIYGGRYQCVEYIIRFYVWALIHKNMRDAFPRPQHAKYFYDRYQELELNRYPNNGTVPPQPGDIICSNGGDYGHVAICA